MRRSRTRTFFKMTPEEIKIMLEAGLPDCKATVVSDDDTHFVATVICDAFAGKRLLQRHQMVYAALGDAVGGDIHALSIEALTSGESASVDAPGDGEGAAR